MSPNIHAAIVEQLNSGVIMIDAEAVVLSWNRFMESHTSYSNEAAVGQSIFTLFPELPQKWFMRKVNSVLMLNTPSFSSWEQRSHLFNLPHNRPFTTESQFMAQNCTFLPMPGEQGAVASVCILIEDVTDTAFYQNQLRQTMKELEVANRIDGLTRAANRRHWEEMLEQEFSRAKRYNQDLSLIMFDLDRFKNVNDTYGHRVGDKVLIDLVKFISPMLRANDLLGRYGGEEFGILLPQTGIDDAAQVAQRIAQDCANHAIHCDDVTLNVTLSMGVHNMLDAYNHYDQLLTHADMALYHAKRNGRNRVSRYSDCGQQADMSANI